MGNLLIIVGLVLVCVGIFLVFGLGWIFVLLDILDPKGALPLNPEGGAWKGNKNPKTRKYGVGLILIGIILAILGLAPPLVK